MTDDCAVCIDDDLAHIISAAFTERHAGLPRDFGALAHTAAQVARLVIGTEAAALREALETIAAMDSGLHVATAKSVARAALATPTQEGEG